MSAKFRISGECVEGSRKCCSCATVVVFECLGVFPFRIKYGMHVYTIHIWICVYRCISYDLPWSSEKHYSTHRTISRVSVKCVIVTSLLSSVFYNRINCLFYIQLLKYVDYFPFGSMSLKY